MTDDMRTDDLIFMPRTRKILGAGGLEFENSFSPNPLCCPARASFLSGQYSHNHRVFSHLPPWGFGDFDDRFTLGTAMKQAGYNTGFVGKYLNGYGKQRSKVTKKPSLRYVPKGWTDWYAAVELAKGSGYKGGTYHYFNTVYNHNGRIDDRHKGEYSTNGIGTITRRMVTRFSKADKPFFIYSNFVAPHHGGPVEKDDVRKVRSGGETVTLVTPARPTWVKGRFDSLVKRAPGLPRGGGQPEPDTSDKPPYLRNPVYFNTALKRGLRNVTRQRAESLYVVDQQVAKLVATLKDAGVWDQTVLMFTSDNGYFLGEHGVPTGKIKGHEPSLRVPFLVTGPGMRSGEKRYDPITTIDVTATILDLAGATDLMRAKKVQDGTSRLTTMLSGDQGWTVPVVSEGHLWASSNPRRRTIGFRDARSYIGLRTQRYSYLRYDSGRAELYDLKNDANQMRSRISDPSYRQVRTRLRALWDDYAYCRGNACRAPLPAAFQATPAESRTLTLSFWDQVDKVHGY